MKKTAEQLMEKVCRFKKESYPIIYEAIGGEFFCYKYNVVARELSVIDEKPALYLMFAEPLNNIVSVRIFENGVNYYDLVFTATCRFSTVPERTSMIRVPKNDLKEALVSKL